MNDTNEPTAPHGDVATNVAGESVPTSPTAPARGRSFLRPQTAFLICGVAAIAIGIGASGVAVGLAIGTDNSTSIAASGTTGLDSTGLDSTGTDSTGTDTSNADATGPGMYAQPGIYTPRGSESTTDTSTDATAATDDQQVGVVTIVSTLDYNDASQAAGTGVILSSTGEILTNNHVISGATSIEVTVESTGRTYEAEVVGSNSTADVAVLQLDDASGLTPAAIDDSSTVAVSDTVTAIGNAQGTGDLVAAAGTVTALDESIEVGNEYTGATESLSDLIQVDADVVSGDSGGPLLDADGEVIGITTAASSGTADITGYAIEIDTALAIVDQIEAGEASDTVVIGTPAFLGVTLSDETATSTDSSTAGVTIAGALDGLPAADAGLVAGDTITRVDGEAVATAEELSAAIASHEPGDSVTVKYLDASGDSHTATVTLIAGPAD